MAFHLFIIENWKSFYFLYASISSLCKHNGAVFINTEILLILFQTFFFINLYVGRIADQTGSLFLKRDHLILESKILNFSTKFIFRYVIKNYDQKLSQIMCRLQ